MVLRRDLSSLHMWFASRRKGTSACCIEKSLSLERMAYTRLWLPQKSRGIMIPWTPPWLLFALNLKDWIPFLLLNLLGKRNPTRQSAKIGGQNGQNQSLHPGACTPWLAFQEKTQLLRKAPPSNWIVPRLWSWKTFTTSALCTEGRVNDDYLKHQAQGHQQRAESQCFKAYTFTSKSIWPPNAHCPSFHACYYELASTGESENQHLRFKSLEEL